MRMRKNDAYDTELIKYLNKLNSIKLIRHNLSVFS